MQENIEDDMLSRAHSYDMLGSFIAMPIGQLAWGPLGETFGDQRVLVASGLAYVVICGLVLLSRSVRTLPRTRLDEPATATVAP
jgi:MFS family permease